MANYLDANGERVTETDALELEIGSTFSIEFDDGHRATVQRRHADEWTAWRTPGPQKAIVRIDGMFDPRTHNRSRQETLHDAIWIALF